MDIFTIILHAFLFVTLYFEIFLFVTLFEYWYGRKRNEQRTLQNTAPDTGGVLPRVAIIVPAHNEERTIAGTLTSLQELDYPKDRYEVIVVDDGSTDATAACAAAYAQQDPRIRLIAKANGGKHTALNAGIQATEADIVGCLDADSFVAPDALRAMVSAFDQPSVMAATPAIRVHNPVNLVEVIQKVEYEIAIFMRRVFALLNAQYVTPGPFSLYQRSVFDTVGLFSCGYFTEDMEIAMRIRAHHFEIKNVPQALVYTTPPKRLVGLYRQRLRWVSGFLSNVIWDYRHLVLRTQYGHLGMLSLPAALFATVITIYMIGYVVVTGISAIASWVATWGAMNFDATWLTPSFEWYMLPMSTTTILTALLTTLTVALILFGRTFVSERRLLSVDILPFLLCYGLIAPFWIAASIFHALFPRSLSWRK